MFPVRPGVPTGFIARGTGHEVLVLIAIDGSRNPAVARYAPALVHTAADLEPGVAMIILPRGAKVETDFSTFSASILAHNLAHPPSAATRVRPECRPEL